MISSDHPGWLWYSGLLPTEEIPVVKTAANTRPGELVLDDHSNLTKAMSRSSCHNSDVTRLVVHPAAQSHKRKLETGHDPIGRRLVCRQTYHDDFPSRPQQCSRSLECCWQIQMMKARHERHEVVAPLFRDVFKESRLFDRHVRKTTDAAPRSGHRGVIGVDPGH